MKLGWSSDQETKIISTAVVEVHPHGFLTPHGELQALQRAPRYLSVPLCVLLPTLMKGRLQSKKVVAALNSVCCSEIVWDVEYLPVLKVEGKIQLSLMRWPPDCSRDRRAWS